MGSIIPAILLILFDMLFLKIGLAITKAEVKKNMKWVAISYGIQLGVIFFVCSPLILYGMIGALEINPGIMILVVFFSLFIDVNIINLIHRIGIKRSVVVVFFVVLPLVTAISILSSPGGSF